MNIILINADEVRNDLVVLTDYRADHLVKILRAQPGQTLLLGIINGSTGSGTVLDIQRKHPRSVTLRVQLSHKIPVQPQIDLILALPRPIMLKRILRDATALGVGSFFIVNARRVEKSFWDSSLITMAEYQEHLITGLEQGVDTKLPNISFHKGFKPFVENNLEQIKSEYSQLIVAHPGKTTYQITPAESAQSRTLLAIGPEGGWIDYEISRFAEAGFRQYSFSKRILRVDTAVIAFMSAIMSAS
ncbi:MAG: 16S rRNA (uracil(1498)-N(3))-methyltransferase [Desulfobulbaceae bacterium]|nr:MAG: 16S rRNA (uracil(1498)-N(3))-methyltransferase [Desulfobulbaceae bacterium]